jgi:hypothetical protein
MIGFSAVLLLEEYCKACSMQFLKAGGVQTGRVLPL